MHLSLASSSANKFLTEMVSVSTGETASTITSFNTDLGKDNGHANLMGMNDKGENLQICVLVKMDSKKITISETHIHKIASHSWDRPYGSITARTAITKSLRKSRIM